MMSMSAEESSGSKKVDPTSERNDGTSRSLSSCPARSPCRSPAPAASSSKKTSEKLLNHNKKLHLVSKGVTSLTNDLWPSSGIHPSWFSSPRLIRMSEATSASTSTSASSTTTPSHTKSRETKSIDSNTCNSQARWSSTDVDPLDGYSTASVSRHKGDDLRWEAIRLVNSKGSPISLGHFRLVKRIGYGDIGYVYLAELKGTNTVFAIKMMDKASLVNRNKLLRAQTEREILSLLDHPFLPSLYSHFETEKSYCLVMEYCNGGNLHSLRQKQPNKHFTEKRARFYATEVLLAIEYLHMLGIIYRDLKPENVLVRDDGHIMLSDFDLSLQCSFNPTLIQASSSSIRMASNESILRGCIHPTTFLPRILPKKTHRSKLDFGLRTRALMELMAEPTDVRSMSFVGTHEYLAPEIIRGEGHGSAVDWWTLGIFLFELMYGTTPFKGSENRATLFNIVGQPLLFTKAPPMVSVHAQDLIRGLLVKEPQNRVGYRRGAVEIKQHPFFEGVNWPLVRSATPPYIPEPLDMKQFGACRNAKGKAKEVPIKNPSNDSSNVNFEFF